MQTEGLWFIEQDIPLYSNRYIHCANSDTFIMVGSQPVIRFGKHRAMLGTFRFFDEAGAPLDGREGVTARFRAGESGWEAQGVSILTGAPEDAHAAIVRICSEKPVRVQFGGVHYVPVNGQDDWNVCPDYEGNYRTVAFDETTKGERYSATADGWSVQRDETDRYLAQRLGHPVRLLLTASFPLRIENGLAVGECRGEAFIQVSLCDEGNRPLPLAEAFASMETRADRLCARLRLSTPFPLLDTACAYTANYQDGVWYPPKMMHSDTSWNMPYLGWTNRYGNDALGWHDRILTEVRRYSAAQNTADGLTGAPQGKEHRGTMPDRASRFYGKGFIPEDQNFYNMQSLFFDQAIHSWRATGSAELRQVLRPMLELHCEWMDDCFDRGGIYESVIDTWPTDSVWNDGGGAPEATCFALRAHEAVRDMAALDGDAETERRHAEKAQQIRTAFHTLLWSRRLGVAGKCREQGTDRLLENPWSYSVFLPIDMDLLDEMQAAQSLYYSKWAYQNDVTPTGRIVYHSNWLPMIWSVRWSGATEQYMLANAFFKSGFPEDGLALLHGMLDSRIGKNGELVQSLNLGSDGSRAALEGLFGYRPDYPHGKVKLAPSIPFDWKDAALENADVRLVYHRDESCIRLTFALTQSAAVDVELLADGEVSESFTCPQLIGFVPGFGRSKALLHFGQCTEGTVELPLLCEKAPILPTELTAAPGETVLLPCTGRPDALFDPQQAVSGFMLTERGITVTAAEVSGHHWLCARIPGHLPRYEIFHLTVTETDAERRLREGRQPDLSGCTDRIPVDIAPQFNCAVQDIYRQQYLSPRPETVSARLGTDGYSPWTFDFWQNKVPEIVPEQTGTLHTADGIPLQVADGAQNIAFVSRWDNFPQAIDFPVNDRARAAVLLLCGTTNPMQCGVENVRLTFRYADGVTEQVPLANPTEFWSLCPLEAMPSSGDQVNSTNSDYDYTTSAFCLPATPPETLQLGKNCRAVVVRWQLRAGKTLRDIRLEAIAKEIVIGVMAVTLVR